MRAASEGGGARRWPASSARILARLLPLGALGGLGIAAVRLGETGWLDQGLFGLALAEVLRCVSIGAAAALLAALLAPGTRLRPAIASRPPGKAWRALCGATLALWLALGAVVLFARVSAPSGPHVVLLVVDALRADRLGAYGRSPSVTPRIDALAAGGTLYRCAYSSSTYTVPAMATLFTSTHPPVHRVSRAPGREGPEELLARLPEGYLLLTELFRDAGWETAAITTVGWVSPESNYDQGVDEYRLVPRGDGHLVEAAGELLARSRGRPLFLYLHFVDLHDYFRSEQLFEPDLPLPDDLSEAFLALRGQRPRAIYRALGEELALPGALSDADLAFLLASYDRWLARTDAWIGEVLDLVEELPGETVVALTSDHGEQFLEHGALVHGGDGFYNEVLAVPLVVRDPRHGAAVVEEPVGLVDVAPILSSAAGIGSHELFQGSAEPVAGAGALATDGATWKLLTERFSLIAAPERGRLELYDLAADPGELEDVSGHPEYLEDAERLRRLLAARIRDALRHPYLDSVESPATAEMSSETQERLRALGYLD